MNTNNRLENELVELGYIELFMRQDKMKIEEILQNNSVEDLKKLVKDSLVTALAKFLASEILFYKKEDFIPEIGKEQIMNLYAHALTNNFTIMPNPWGLPGEIGIVGENILKIKDPPILAWMDCLNNETLMQYGGSKEATIGNSYHYRIKDIAAFYISIIKKINFTIHKNPKDRDKEIEKLILN